jgi:hypothetical protein
MAFLHYATDFGARHVARLHLTDIGVRALKSPGQGSVTYWDTTMPSFGVRVSHTGRKTWLVIRGKTRTRTCIGTYPDYSLAEARQRGRELLSKKALEIGRKPFDEALDQFIELHGQDGGLDYKLELRRMLHRHFLPVYGHQPVGNITRQSVAVILDSMKDTPSNAAHAYRNIHSFFTWCVARGYLQHSPCEGMGSPHRYPWTVIRMEDRDA